MSNNHHIVIQLLLTLAVTSPPSIAAEVPGRDPNKRILTQEEKIVCYAEGYPNTSTSLKLAENSGYPWARFIVSFAKNGIGHLQSTTDYPRKTVLKEPELLVWNDRISFYVVDEGWTKLSLENKKKKIFGQSKTVQEKSEIYTFEVPNVPVIGAEKDIYKIDTKFDDKGIIQSYRVSGPRISNPTWVSN
jgi:hypothetical protein